MRSENALSEPGGPDKQTIPQRKDHNVKHAGFQINLSSPFYPCFVILISPPWHKVRHQITDRIPSIP